MTQRLDLRWVLVVVIAVGCGTPPRPQLAPVVPAASPLLLGCWQLQSLDWRDYFLPGAIGVRFDTAGATGDNSTLRTLHVDTPDSLRARLRITGWALYKDMDSLYAVVGDRFGGLEFRLSWTGDSITRRAYSFTDVPHFRSSGKVAGRRTSC